MIVLSIISIFNITTQFGKMLTFRRNFCFISCTSAVQQVNTLAKNEISCSIGVAICKLIPINHLFERFQALQVVNAQK
jgi:hypothetical protein